MLRVGDYVMINKNAYNTCYHPELDNLFYKVARIVAVERSKNSDLNNLRWYTLDITKNCTFQFKFTERFLININNGI